MKNVVSMRGDFTATVRNQMLRTRNIDELDEVADIFCGKCRALGKACKGCAVAAVYSEIFAVHDDNMLREEVKRAKEANK